MLLDQEHYRKVLREPPLLLPFPLGADVPPLGYMELGGYIYGKVSSVGGPMSQKRQPGV